MDTYAIDSSTDPLETGSEKHQTLRDVFARNLRYYRRKKKISQEKLSLAINMSITYINGLENKYSFPQPESIEEIARVLDIRPYQLFMEDGCPENIVHYDKEGFINGMVSDISSTVIKNIENQIRNALK